MAPTVYTPPVNTYIPIGSVTLSATASEVVFSSVPTSGYRDLVVIISATSNGGSGLVGMQFNGDTASNYTNVGAYGEAPTTTGSFADTRAYIVGSITGVSTTTPTMLQIQLQDYSASDKHKTALVRNNYPTENTSMLAGRWANTSPITSIRFYFTGTGLFAVGSTFSLYAIAG